MKTERRRKAAVPNTLPADWRASREVLNVDEVAALLQMPRSTAYQAVQDGSIPGRLQLRPGGVVRVQVAAFKRWLDTDGRKRGAAA